jgi:membrane protein DedA with SNARE-associated domain
MKLFELAAGVFEMKLVWYFSAILAGKFLRFVIVSFLIIFFGQRILNTLASTLHFHRALVLSGFGLLLLLIVAYTVRKFFSRKQSGQLAAEEES